MDNSAIIGIHLPEGHRFAGAYGFFGQPHGQFFQVFLTGLQVSFDIHQNPDPVFFVLIDNFFNDGLNGIQRLSPFADQNARVSAINVK